MKQDFARQNSATKQTVTKISLEASQQKRNNYFARKNQATTDKNLLSRNIPLVFHPLSLFEMHITYP
ncbi:MAG: hypothetical protein EZS28_038660 [Streblomastix strix]|uniref:Uncharacterized protein n=1 Tax=Streblomastix strix TaxID=222440 RepID=A0A5J4U761_9EUKA|nr:MAG: hypothetical protein EZS28_038660 [Streblomastix strix]